MKRTDLNIFYNLGKTLADIHKVSIGMKMTDAVMELVMPRTWLYHFLEQTKDVALPESIVQAKRLYACIEKILSTAKQDWQRPISQAEVQELSAALNSLEENFEEECKRIAVFTVLPKGIYDTSALINTPEQKFSEKIRALLPSQMLYDLKQAARCLAFEIPTACAFHVCRGTEALMLEYYRLLAKKTWAFKKKDWKIYIEQLTVEKAPQRITNRLNEIRELDRNAFIHPDINVTLEEAPILFELCTGVVFLIGQEMEKLSP